MMTTLLSNANKLIQLILIINSLIITLELHMTREPLFCSIDKLALDGLGNIVIDHLLIVLPQRLLHVVVLYLVFGQQVLANTDLIWTLHTADQTLCPGVSKLKHQLQLSPVSQLNTGLLLWQQTLVKLNISLLHHLESDTISALSELLTGCRSELLGWRGTIIDLCYLDALPDHLVTYFQLL